MGYYITLEEADFVVPALHEAEALEALKELNKRDELKTGGSYSGGVQTERWFAWTPPDYDETATSVKGILELLGFDTEKDELGGTFITYYDNKTGAEEHFLRALAPFVKNGSYLQFVGEDGERYRYVVRDGKLVTEYARVVWPSS